jgi:hypothetical protein
VVGKIKCGMWIHPMTDPAHPERNASMLLTRVPHRRIAGRAGYCSRLLIVLVVVAVAQRRLGPGSSAATSTMTSAAVLGGPGALLEPAHDHATRLP